jgi:3-phenylpropionate/cinnamic acid dioxygenase small subunit
MQKCAFWITAALGTASALLTGMAVSGNISVQAAEKKETVEARLQRLEDREAIRNLLMDYGRFLDQRNFNAFSQLFSEQEGEWIGGLGRAKGSRSILKLMEDTIGKDTKNISAPNRHLFSNEIIRVDGDRAEALTKWMFVVTGENDRPQPFYLGHYDDTFVREKGHWKFLRRTVYGDIPFDDPLARK